MPLPLEVEADIALEQSAILFIDMQRRHLDLEVGYHTLPPDRAKLVVQQGAEVLAMARPAGMRVVHVATWSRHQTPWGGADARNPFMQWQTGQPIPGSGFVRQSGKCVEGSVWAEIMPPVTPVNHEPVVLKKKYSGFYGTDLEQVMRSLGVKTIFIGGVNTNNCVLGTFFDAHARDFRTILLEDVCGSMNGQAYHEAGVRQIEAALGWVITVDDLRSLISRKTAAAS